MKVFVLCWSMKLRTYKVNPALIVIDVQNGFVSKGGSYDLLGLDTTNYRAVIATIRKLIEVCRRYGLPVFYTQAVRESSGMYLLTKNKKKKYKKRKEDKKKK